MLHSFDCSAAGSPHTSDELNAVCRSHWQRLFVLAMKRGFDPHAAEDAVQDVFAALLRCGQIGALASLSEENQSRHLTTRLMSRLANIWRDQRREKRGGGIIFIPLTRDDGGTLVIADERVRGDSDDLLSKRYIINRALTALRSEMKPARWRVIAPCLLNSHATRHQTGAIRVALHRARRRLRELLAA